MLRSSVGVFRGMAIQVKVKAAAVQIDALQEKSITSRWY